MSIKTRTDIINKASDTVVIHNSTKGHISGSISGFNDIQLIDIRRQKNQDILIDDKKINVLVYKTHCENGSQCKGNNHKTTNCYHVLAFLQESFKLAGFVFSKMDNPKSANKLRNLGHTILKIVSDGEGVTFATLHPQKNPNIIDNLKNLISTDRIGLTRKGQQIPIGKGIYLFYRSDGRLALRRGCEFSKPVMFYGRDWNAINIQGTWKLTEDAKRIIKDF